MKHMYLGDGVYAKLDESGMIWLYLEVGDMIALEKPTLEALIIIAKNGVL